MTPSREIGERLRFLVRVVQRESAYLQSTDQRLYAHPFTAQRAARLQADPDEAERVEALIDAINKRGLLE